MKISNIDTYIITKFDPHQSEYSQMHWGGVQFISGFSGSSGTLVVTLNEAGLWTDGRYYIQAEKEIAQNQFVLYKASEPNTISYLKYSLESTPVNGKIAFDGRTISYKDIESLVKKSKVKKITIENDIDLLGDIWTDRPNLSVAKIFEHDIKYCGKSRTKKIEEVRSIMRNENMDTYVISGLDDIAWLFNLRGLDVATTPIFDAYSIITHSECILFTHANKIDDVKSILINDNITIKNYDDIFEFINTIKKDSVIGINPEKTNYSIWRKLNKFELIEIPVDITTELKAVKNEIELKNLQKCHIRDGVAMVKILKWIKETVHTNTVSEFEIGEKVTEIRNKGENYLIPSFDTICGYKENGSIMHYSATKDDCSIVEPNGFLLLDSGATYLDGTTDITRTIVLGDLDEKMKSDFTLVLKSHIALFNSVYLYGTTGSNIDILARMPMWKNGLDYKCGTGHGIGFCLGVHEGPHRISRVPNSYKLEVGMLVSNEPGVYREGMYGIRTENIAVVKHIFTTEAGKFLELSPISYCPIDIKAIVVSMLDENELKWINDYHKLVYDKLNMYLSDDEKEWLKNETKAI
jgi:Xaa-Pro aminopeptidase